MSYFALLAAQSASEPSTPPVTDPPAAIAWPTAADATITSLRPTGRQIQALASGGLSAAVTATDALKAEATRRIKGTSVQSLGKVGPDYRGDFILTRGSHHGEAPALPWGALVGETGDPADTEVWSDTVNSGGTMHTWESTYVEGITFRNEADATAGTGPKYPLHMTAGAFASQSFVRCRFISHASLGGSTPGQWSGMDGGQGSYTLFYGCHFEGNAANLHGAAGNVAGLTIVFVNCTGVGFDYSDLGVGSPDRIYVVDSPLGPSTVRGANVQVHAIGQTGTINLAGGATTKTATTWPKATGAVGEPLASWWGPSRVTEAHTQAIQADTTMTATPGRIYYVPVPITDALHATHAGVAGYPAGSVALSHTSFQGNGAYPKDLAVTPTPTTKADWLPPKQATAHEIASWFYRTMYPGERYTYLAVRALTGDTIPASSTLAASLPCYITADEGVTMTQVPAGTPHPTAYLRSAVAG